MEEFPAIDPAKASRVFAAAMESDPLHAWFFPNAEKRRVKLERMYALVVLAGRGDLLFAPDGSGYLLRKLPHAFTGNSPKAVPLVWAAFRLLAVLRPGEIFRLVAYALASSGVRRRQMPRGAIYVSVAAVDPARQGKGVGSSLFRRVIEEADTLRVPSMW
jgi:ribosomal protein S18 acetylase RimI-like enzyme